MAYLARYAHVSPGEFGTMTPARTRTLTKHVGELVDDEWKGFVELARAVATSAARR